MQMFSLHVGGELQLPVRATKAAPVAPVAAAAASPKERDVFDGVPLRAWAEVRTTILLSSHFRNQHFGRVALVRWQVRLQAVPTALLPACW